MVTGGVFLGGAVFVFIIIDLSQSTIIAQQKAEEKIKALNESLEQRVSERTLDLKRLSDFNRTVLDSIVDPISIIDVNTFRIVDYNQAFLNQINIPESQIAGRTCYDITHNRLSPCLPPHDSCPLTDTLSNDDHAMQEHIHWTPSGEIRYVEVLTSPIRDEKGKIIQAVHIQRDVTERKKSDAQIMNLAYYDNLTGLPNRILFQENLDRALASAERKKHKVATLFLDLDRFKWINDTMGHSVGDNLLKEFATRLVKSVRKNDCITHNTLSRPMHPIARLGGDEFTIILDDIHRSQDAAVVARRIIEESSKPFVLEGHEVFVTASIGISIYPDDSKDIVTLIKYADTAMYHAKELGKNNFQFYSKSMTDNAFEILLLENQLRHALDLGEFTLHYQPQVDMQSGRMFCMEALLRWQNPELGMIPPSTFIPLAEETGMIVGIDEWVVTEACRQLKKWEDAGLTPVRIAVNLSGQNFRQKNLSDKIRKILSTTGVRADSLELELTEGVLMHNGEEAVATMIELKAMGLSLAIDDFGTGYSSLSYLKRFRLDTLKIDRSFIQDLATDSDNTSIVTAIIALAEGMKLKVVAEGVETAEQLQILRNLGCHRIQGFLLDRPMPSNDMTVLLSDNKRYVDRH
jgi:diguanylate cyclase (GGDEF)-like protein/PAS domain S-box-containing protein